ncbi:aminotransferase class I/II-fold pyridoxal phosphate-dependent enzyme [Micromonospora echinofusca]|uniref:aminotransferase class I/II-fold pyridoxal phosphate-dependent enzyme n=1 Tax=Micromonospora echinofusca TaxID=47858 RepID=UPI0033F796DE
MADATDAYGRRLGAYLEQSSYTRLRGGPGVIDLAFGDPHEFPAPALVEVLQRHLSPQHTDWFAYTRDHPPAQESVAATLSRELGLPFTADDVALTNGAFAGLTICLRSVCDPGDEVIYLDPAWFYYEPIIASVGAVPRPVALTPGSWRLDADLVAAAITPRTVAVIVNSPNNPTGAVYTDDEFAALAEVLREASARNGRPIYLLSDEAYRRIVFGGRPCPSPATHYPYTFLVHTYTKTLLLPGERVGYVAIPPTTPDPAVLRRALTVARLTTGWAFPNNSLLFALPELEQHAVQVKPIEQRRDLLVDALREAGYEVQPSEGTFYLMARVPDADDWTHAALLEEHGLLVLPASVMGAPGYLRLSLTVTDEMLEETIGRLRSARPSNREHAGVQR